MIRLKNNQKSKPQSLAFIFILSQFINRLSICLSIIIVFVSMWTDLIFATYVKHRKTFATIIHKATPTVGSCNNACGVGRRCWSWQRSTLWTNQNHLLGSSSKRISDERKAVMYHHIQYVSILIGPRNKDENQILSTNY